MNTAVIITKKAGQVPPLSYLEEALKNCPTCYGLVVQDKDADGEFLDSAAENRTISAKDLHAQLEKLKDCAAAVWLGHMTQDFDASDDLQPWVFQEAAEGEAPTDVLAIMVEGDLPNYSAPGKGHTEEYHFWENFLYPTILEKWQVAGGDHATFFQKLRESLFEQSVTHSIGHRGAIVLVPLSGDIIAFGKNELGGEYDWGTTSNRFGWGDQSKLKQAATAAVEAVKKTRGRLAGMMDTSTMVVVPEQPRPDPKPTTAPGNPPGVHNVPPKTTPSDPFAAWPGTSNKTHTMFTVPPGLQGNARNRWIRTFLNLDAKADLPKGKDNKDFKIPVPNSWVGFAQEDVATNDEVRDLASKLKSFQASGSVSAGMAAVARGDVDPKKMASTTKVEPTAAPPKKGGDVEVRPTSDFLPEFTADEKAGAMEVIHDWATNSKRPAALEIQKIETKWPLPTSTFGITWADVSTWSIADRKLLCKKHPNIAALFLGEAILRANGAIVDDINTEVVNDPPKKDDKQVTTTPAQPQPTPTQPATKPAGRKSRLAALTDAA